MQNLIKRYFWVLGVVTIVVCAIFAAKASNHVVEAQVLGYPAVQARRGLPPPPRPDAQTKPVRDKDGTQLASRNMFCSECVPATPTVTTTDPTQVAITQLPLQLIATNVGATDRQSFATLVNTSSFKSGSFAIGDQIPGATGVIRAIRYKYVDFENNNHVERVMLAGAEPVTTPTAPTVEDKPAGDGDDITVAIETGIKKIDETNYEIDRSLVDKVIANPMAFTRGARVVPAVKGGKTEGIKLYAIRPTSPYAKLGLTNGDTLSSINGFELTSMDKGLEIYSKLREATHLEVEIVRRGKPMTLKYNIR
jgi:general secretion pathway protein C